MKRFSISDLAIRDIEEMWDYVAGDSVDRADALVDEIYEEIRRIGPSPAIGHRRTTWASIVHYSSGPSDAV